MIFLDADFGVGSGGSSNYKKEVLLLSVPFDDDHIQSS